MPASSRASASVVAVGVVAIIGGAFGALCTLFMLFVFQFSVGAGRAFPPTLRPFLNVVWVFLLACDAFVVVAGAQLIRLRNWARVALLVVAGCMFFFGIVGIGVILFTIFMTPVDPAVSKTVLATVLAFIYGIPVVVAFWWLILLTRRPVAEQFQRVAASEIASTSSASVQVPSLLNNPQCPLAVRIIGWYLASFGLFLPIVPFLPFHAPAYYLGHVFRGPAATVVLFANLLLLSITGIGLLLIKRWSYPFTIASQVFLCLNSLFAVFSPSFYSVLRETFSEMRLPDLPFGVEQVFHYVRYFNLFGLIIPVAIIATLIFYRHSFSAASNGNSGENATRIAR